MANPIIDKKVAVLDQLLSSGKITQDMYDANKASVINSIKDLPSQIESTGGYRKQFEPAAPTADTLSNVMDTLKNKGKVTNASDAIKVASESPIGIDPSIRNKGLFDKLDERMGLPKNVIDDVTEGGKLKNAAKLEAMIPPKTEGFASRLASEAEHGLESAGKVANEEGGFLKNLKGTKGFSKVLPMLGMGAAGLAALGIGQKAMAGDLGGAGLDAADTATDFMPVIGQAKMALRPSELGNGELPPEEMEKQNRFNQIQKRLQNK